MKKILIVDHFMVTPYFETSVEIALNNLDEGNEVSFYYVDIFYDYYRIPSHLKLSFFKNLKWLKNDKKKKIKVLQILEAKGCKVFHLKNKNIFTFLKAFKYALFHPLSIDLIKNYEFYGVNLGIGVASSYVSRLGDDEPILHFKSLLIKKMLFESALAYQIVRKKNSNNYFSEFYTLNGRNYLDNAFVKSSQNMSKKIFVYELGFNYSKYELFEYPLHSFLNISKAIDLYWGSADANKVRIAEDFFIKNKTGTDFNVPSFSKKFQNKLIDIKTTKRKIVYFTSSDDEIAFIDDSEQVQPIFSKQKNLLNFLKIWAVENDNIQLVIRIHPNISSKSKRLKSFWNDLKIPGVIVYPSYSKINSYELIDWADVIISYGSTIGFEATYWGKPSISVGLSYYRSLNCTYNPESEDELRKLLNDDSLMPILKSKCLPFAYYLVSFGFDYKYFKPQAFNDGYLTIDGEIIKLI